jgi:cellulose synthase/poly-beta-1,6-N-acetylglucosamine synthase-like glycosyltransferase
MIKDYPLISVVIPVKNEAALLSRCLESLMKLDYPKEGLEIIIADGLSTDNTKDVASSFGVKVVANDRQIVVSGRNRGFEVARGDIIAFTDADCIFDARWLRNSIKYFTDDDLVGGVGGVTLAPQDSSSFEKAVDFLFHLAEIFQTTAHRRHSNSAKEVNDIPGCNSLYRKSVLSKVMPVDENLLTAEDVWMNLCIKNYGYKFILAPDVILWHYRRSSPKRFLRQIYRFAIGRMQVGRRAPKLFNIFHILAALSLPVLLVAGIFFYFSAALSLFLKIILAFFIVVLFLSWVKTKSPLVALNLPLVVVIFIFAWSIGFLKELFFPLKEAKGK